MPSSLVSVQPQSGRGGTAISTYTPQTQHSFARTTALLDQLGLNIVDARITPTADGFSLDVYHVLEDTGADINDAAAHARHPAATGPCALQARRRSVTVTRRAPRQVRMFTTATQITFSDDPVNQRTIIELIAGDRPGLAVAGRKDLLNEQHRHLHVEDHDGRRARRRRVLCRRSPDRQAAQRRGA